MPVGTGGLVDRQGRKWPVYKRLTEKTRSRPGLLRGRCYFLLVFFVSGTQVDSILLRQIHTDQGSNVCFGIRCSQ